MDKGSDSYSKAWAMLGPGLGVLFPQGTLIQTVFTVRSGTLGRETDKESAREMEAGGSLCLVSINMLNDPAVFVSWLSHMNM